MIPVEPARLLRPRFVALDTSHLGAVARDLCSKDKARQKRVSEFQQGFDKSGSVLLLCWHHVQELLSYQDEGIRAQRMEFIKSLPIAAGITSFNGEPYVGTITDIQRFEVAIAFRQPEATVTEIRDEAAKVMFQLGSGADLVRSILEAQHLLQPMFAKHQSRSREIIAITRSNFAGISHVKVLDLLNQSARSPAEIELQLKRFHENLRRDIVQRGDKRIANPEFVSAAFMEDVRQRGMAAIRTGNPGEQILLMHDIDVSEIGPETTVDDVGAMAAFRKKLSLLNESLKLPWAELKKRVAEDRIPSGVIESSIAKYHPDTSEWDGSELADRHLACLSAYADLTYVDKRTHEAFRQARQKSSSFANLVRRAEKAADYTAVSSHLNAV
jgi:hypothetical protein